MSRDSCQLCPETGHCPRYQCPRYQRKRPPEPSPGAVFMSLVNGFANVSLAHRLIPGSSQHISGTTLRAIPVVVVPERATPSPLWCGC
jgi:hypothetical protein